MKYNDVCQYENNFNTEILQTFWHMNHFFQINCKTVTTMQRTDVKPCKEWTSGLTPFGSVTALHIAITQLHSSTAFDADNSSGVLCAKRISNVCCRSLCCVRRQPRHCSWLQPQQHRYDMRDMSC